jgi:hypothetical protein
VRTTNTVLNESKCRVCWRRRLRKAAAAGRPTVRRNTASAIQQARNAQDLADALTATITRRWRSRSLQLLSSKSYEKRCSWRWRCKTWSLRNQISQCSQNVGKSDVLTLIVFVK